MEAGDRVDGITHEDIWWLVCPLCLKAFNSHPQLHTHKRVVAHGSESTSFGHGALIFSQSLDLNPTVRITPCFIPCQELADRPRRGRKRVRTNGKPAELVKSQSPATPRGRGRVVPRESRVSACSPNVKQETRISLTDFCHTTDDDHANGLDSAPSPVSSTEFVFEDKQRDPEDKDTFSETCGVCLTTFATKSELKKNVQLIHTPNGSVSNVDPIEIKTETENVAATPDKLPRLRPRTKPATPLTFEADDPDDAEDEGWYPEGEEQQLSEPDSNESDNYNEEDAGEKLGSPKRRRCTGTIEDRTCSTCSLVYTRVDNRQRHEALKHGPNTFLCLHEYCGRRYARKEDLETHIRTHDDSNRLHVCEVCSKTFFTRKELKLHKDTHIDKTIKCPICDSMVKTKAYLQQHLRIVHNDARPWRCDQCPASFKYKRDVRQHQMCKHVPKCLLCPHCGLAFSTHKSLQTHIRTHDEANRVHVCDVCTKAFFTVPELIVHKRTHNERTIMCPDCGKMFKTERDLKALQVNTHSDIQPFKCEKCPAAFKVKSYLRVHLQTHNTDRTYKCPQCPKAYRTHNTLRSHKERVHIAKPRICGVCSQEFRGKSSLSRHELDVHNFLRGEVRYECEHCGKIFSGSGPFKVHLISHKSERQFKCESCEKSFKTRANLKQHLVSHLPPDQLPHACDLCGKRFGLPHHVRQHKASVHPEQSEPSSG